MRTFLFPVATGAALLAATLAIALRDDRFRSDTGSDASREGSPAAVASAGPVAPLLPPAPADPASVRQDPRLAHLPERGMTERGSYGPLPVRAADGRRPFDVYSREWSGTRGARIAIVIGNLGVSQTDTMYAIARLPGTVTLAFAPQGNSLGRWMTTARNEGHELLLQLPLEPSDYPRVNPGRGTLTIAAAPEENLDRLHWALARITNYVGVINQMGDRFVADRDALAPVLTEIGRRGLLWLDDGSAADSTAPVLAIQSNAPLAEADGIIDRKQDRAAILEQLDTLERIARARGSALGIGAAGDLTVSTLLEWLAEVSKRGIEIVPVSALARDPERP